MFEDFIMAKLTMDDLVDKIESKFTDSEIDGIRIRGCQIVEDIKDYTGTVWTEQGLRELQYYDPELYRDVPGGTINFIAGAMAVLHKVNGPCWIDAKW